MENEKKFYQDSAVQVTQSRIVVHNKTYAMRNISSVSMFEKHKSNNKLLSIIFLMIGLIFLFNQDYLFGGICIGIAALLLLFLKSDFIVRISSNSGDSNVLVSKNKEYIQNVVSAINEAIIYRG
jgi:type IV secretory pathway component VirB8